jgi:hypothetical protein
VCCACDAVERTVPWGSWMLESSASCHLRATCSQTLDNACGMTQRRSGSLSDTDKRGKYACIVAAWSAHSISWLASRPSPPACLCCAVYSNRIHDFWISRTELETARRGKQRTHKIFGDDVLQITYRTVRNKNGKYSNQNSRWQYKCYRPNTYLKKKGIVGPHTQI